MPAGECDTYATGGEKMPIHLVQGDITEMHVGAIVNAANSELLPGGGVSGAIHAAAGPALTQACADYVIANGPLETGCVAVTPGFHLPARYVIHAVGPVWNGGGSGEAVLLASTYRSAITAADEKGVEHIAFPSISTGIFGYPVHLAAPVAVQAVADSLCSSKAVRDATFVAYDQETFAAYRSAIDQITWEF